MNANFLYDLHTQTTCSSMVLGMCCWIIFSACTYLHAWLKRLASVEPLSKPPVKSVA